MVISLDVRFPSFLTYDVPRARTSCLPSHTPGRLRALSARKWSPANGDALVSTLSVSYLLCTLSIINQLSMPFCSAWWTSRDVHNITLSLPFTVVHSRTLCAV
jgi:hypothetical protein